MAGLTFVMVLMLLAACFYFMVGFIQKRPVKPDPWEKEMSKKDSMDNGIKVCVNCLEPIKDERIHYCPKCGNVVGEYTRYLPYENIQFNYSIFGTIVRKIKNRFKR